MSTGAELLALAKRQRGLERLPAEDGGMDIPEFLESVARFLQEHETTVGNETTHGVYENYVDWWTTQRQSRPGGSTWKLAISEDNTRDQFFMMVAKCESIGLPLTLTERRTAQFKFVQEVDIFGLESECVDPMELLNVEGAFLQLIGKTMQELYPNTPQQFLDVMALDATGRDGKRCVMKTSMRLVWPQIIVDKRRAERIRDYVVLCFNGTDNEELIRLSERMTTFNKDNTWNNVFHDSIYSSRDGLRMPYCDKVSPAPLKKPENRPFKPMGVYRMETGTAGVAWSHTVQPTELEGNEWLTVGSIRQASGTELTEWVEPRIRAERIARSVQSTTPGHGHSTDRSPGTVNGYNDSGRGSGGPASCSEGTVGAAPAIGRDPGRVQVRTRAGSDNYTARPRRERPPQQREPEAKTVERQFLGTMEEFRHQLIQQVGGSEANFTVNDNQLVFQFETEGDGSKIVFNQATKRVFVTGQQEQVRTWCSILGRFVSQVGDAQSTIGGRTAITQRTNAGGARSTALPSRIFAPSTTGSAAGSTAGRAAGTSAHQAAAAPPPASGAPPGTPARVTFRCKQDFEAQGQGELSIRMGDIVCVTQEGEGWAFGWCERAGRDEQGWFPRGFLEATPSRSAS